MADSKYDIIDDLDAEQLQALIKMMEEPDEKDTVSEEEFRKIFEKWGTK